MPSIVSIALVATGCVLFAASPGLAAPAGEVLAIKGDCLVDADGKRAALKLGDPVQVGDTVEVSEGARLKLRMVDGSVISAASGTKVTIEAYAGQPRDAKLTLASGLLRAVVAKAAQPSRFEVGTATGVAAVRSTDWFVFVEPKGTQVGVLDGSVNLTSTATQHGVTIPAHWGARVEPGRDPVPARVWAQSEFDDVIARTNAE
jgi:hypothetical protein